MLIRRTFYLVVSFVFLFSLTFCKTQEKSTKVNHGKIKNVQPIDKQALAASSVSASQMEFSPEEMTEMNDLAEKMTVLYCDIKALELSSEDSDDSANIQSLNSKKKTLSDYRQKADSSFTISSHKARFEQVYKLKKQRCE